MSLALLCAIAIPPRDRHPRFRLPFGDGDFDVVTLVVSIDYLVRPVAILKEARRCLRAGGKVAVSFSNRMFPSKAVDVWRRASEPRRLWLAAAWLRLAGFARVKILDLVPRHRERFRERSGFFDDGGGRFADVTRASAASG